MFKHISAEMAKKISALISVIVGIVLLIIAIILHGLTTKIIVVFGFVSFFISLILGLVIYTVIFSGPIKERNEKNLSYVQGFLSREEFRKVQLNVGDNEFTEFAVNESPISYYAKITSDTEITISIRKDEKEIKSRFIEILYFKRYFTT